MTERDLGQTFSWWIAEVVNVYDPDQSGRVQIRVFGRHDDKSNIPDNDLPWALPMQPVTSAAFGKIGTTPLGLVKGSKVAGFWADSDHQYPIIIGSFGKAGEFIDGTTNDGIPQVDISKGSAPAPSQNQSPPPFINPFSLLNIARLVITDINSGKSDPSKLTSKDGVETRTVLDTIFKQPSTPTVASTASGQHVLDTISQVDPKSLSASLPNMVSNFSNIRNIISITSPLGQTNMMGNILGSVLGNLGAVFGVSNVLKLVGGALGVPGALNPILSGALSIGLISFIKSAVNNNGTTSVYIPPLSNTISLNSPRPPINLIVLTPPNLYIQQYYTIQNDPFPGYIQWQGPNGDYVYTLRNGQPNYSSAQAHIQGDSIASMTASMSPNINSKNLSPLIFAGILAGGLAAMNASGLTKVLGSGVNLASLLGLAKNILGDLGAAINSTVTNHLPQSVLNGSMKDTMTKMTENQAKLQKKKKSMTAALKTPQGIDLNDPRGNQIAAIQSGDLISAATNLGIAVPEPALQTTLI